MARILVITSDEEVRRVCTEAVVRAGRRLRVVASLPDAMLVLSQEHFAGLIVHGLSARELATFAHLSVRRPLPPVVVITDEEGPLALWIHAATRSTSSTAVATLIARLGLMIDGAAEATAPHLPLRLSATAAKWTSRLRAAALGPEVPFDGETSDDLHLDQEP